MTTQSVIKVNDLHTYFFTNKGTVKAVNGISFDLKQKSTLGIVGESGSGKTVTALSILRLVPYPGKIVNGEILFEGKDLAELDSESLRRLRGKEIAMIFQDPKSSLNPVLPIGTQVMELITSHLPVSEGQAKRIAMKVLENAGLPEADKVMSRYPFHLSGGMCQRVMIGIAMALNPKVLIADEPTSALDVTLQAEILAEIRRLKKDYLSSVILITHDLGVIAQMADEVAVMYAGSIVEYANTTTLFQRPIHPYTWALLHSLPRLDVPGQALSTIKGSPPDLLDLADQCPFLPRCNKATNECRNSPIPTLTDIEPDHQVACYNPMRHDRDYQ